jgi:hypothetical protein
MAKEARMAKMENLEYVKEKKKYKRKRKYFLCHVFL